MATVTAGYNWTSGETVTPAKLNSAAAPTVVVADGEVTTAKIVDAAVTDVKLASGIDASKLTTGTLPIARIADGAVTPAKLLQSLTLATAQNTTSGTNIDFTGIPSWVKRITVMLNGVSTNGSTNIQLQIGDSGGIETSGYAGAVSITTTSINTTAFSSGFLLTQQHVSSYAHSGIATICHLGSNAWAVSSVVGGPLVVAQTNYGGGAKTLSDTLTQVRLTTVNGTDTFDAGSINIMYEG